MKLHKDPRHSHYWVENGHLYESYKTSRELTYRFLQYTDLPDTDKLTEEQINKLNEDESKN